MVVDPPNLIVFIMREYEDLRSSGFSSRTIPVPKRLQRSPLRKEKRNIENHEKSLRKHQEPNIDVVKLETGAKVCRKK